MLEAVTEEQDEDFKAAINISCILELEKKKMVIQREIEVRNDPFRKRVLRTMMVW